MCAAAGGGGGRGGGWALEKPALSRVHIKIDRQVSRNESVRGHRENQRGTRPDGRWSRRPGGEGEG